MSNIFIKMEILSGLKGKIKKRAGVSKKIEVKPVLFVKDIFTEKEGEKGRRGVNKSENEYSDDDEPSDGAWTDRYGEGGV